MVINHLLNLLTGMILQVRVNLKGAVWLDSPKTYCYEALALMRMSNANSQETHATGMTGREFDVKNVFFFPPPSTQDASHK